MKRHGKQTPANLGTTPKTVTAGELAASLTSQREIDAARRVDELARTRDRAQHERDLADVAEETRRDELDRTEREATSRADADLNRFLREAQASGARARVTSEMARSGEVRALRLERLRALNLKILVPVLLGFATWSTTGVQHGAAWLMQVNSGDPMWWAMWLLEPVLIGAVAWIIIARARLAVSGGEIGPAAEVIMAGCLITSIGLNLIAGAAGDNHGLKILGAMVAHAIGPAGAALTAHLIGIVDKSITDADPWTDQRGNPVPLLADMDLRLPERTAKHAPKKTESTSGRPVPSGPDEWITAEAQTAAAQIEAWLADREPPSEGLTSAPSSPTTDGPQGAAKAAPEPATEVARDEAHIEAHIETDQAEHDGVSAAHNEAHIEGLTSAADARRAAGERTRKRIADYFAAHPNATVAEIAAAVEVSRATVNRYLPNIRHGNRSE